MCAQVIHLLSMFQPLRQITLANVDSCCASECTSRCLIDCVPGQDEFIKNKKNTKTKKRFCPESSICCIDVGECGQERERDGGKENEEREREEAFSLAFLPLSLSSPMSKTDGAGALCVCVCVCVQALASAD